MHRTAIVLYYLHVQQKIFEESDNTVNQVNLFVITFFFNLMKINWLAATNFHDQDADYLKILYKKYLITGSQQKIIAMTRLWRTLRLYLAHE